jgi:hypothetical protein
MAPGRGQGTGTGVGQSKVGKSENQGVHDPVPIKNLLFGIPLIGRK